MEKEIEVTIDGKKEKITIGQYSARVGKEIREKCMKKQKVGNQTVYDVDEIKATEMMVLNSIKKAPFEINLNNIYDKLTDADFQRLAMEVAKLNTVRESDKKKL